MKTTPRILAGVLAAAGFALTAHGQDFLTNGLVLYYPLNGNALDASGHGIDGTVMGAVPATDRFGTTNGCFSFDGGGQYIVAPADQLPTLTRTVSLWFKANQAANRPGFLGYGGNSCGNSFFMGLNHWGYIAFVVTTHCDAYTLVVPYTNAPVHGWYQWAVVMDTEGMRFYLNSQIIGARTGTSFTPVAGTQLGLGTICDTAGRVPYTDGNVGWFDGLMDDVRIYNRALSTEEIVALYRAEGGVVEPPTFTLNPVSQVAAPGSRVTFTAVATGDPPPNYQWRRNGAELPGATFTSYTIASSGLTDIGLYDLVAGNSIATNASSVGSLALIEMTRAPLPAVSLTGPPGSVYHLEATPTLAPTAWIPLTNVALAAQPFLYPDPGSATNRQRFFRAVPQ